MHKLLKTIMGVGIGIVLTSSALATEVVVFDHQKAIAESNFGKEIIQSMRESATHMKLVEQIEEAQKELKKWEQESVKNSLMWTSEIRREKRARAELVAKSAQAAMAQLQRLQSETLESAAKEIGPRLRVILEEVISSGQADVIVLAQAAIMYKPEVDITEDVVKKLNELPETPEG